MKNASDAEALPVRLGPADAGRCRRRVHLDHDPDADRGLQRAPDAGLALRFDTLTTHRRAIFDGLPEGLPLTESWQASGADRPIAAWATRLASTHRFAAPDLLLRAPDGGYIPVLIRGHRTTDPGSGAALTPLSELAGLAPGREIPRVTTSAKKLRPHHGDTLALAHVYRLLADLGLASGDSRGGIIGFGGSSTEPGWDDGAVIVWHDLAAANARDGGAPFTDYDARFADRLAVATAAARRRPPLAAPSRIAECRRCPWWPVCGPELESTHDVSLLTAGGDVAVLRGAGARTYDDVARMDPAALRALPLTGIPASEAATRARAMLANTPLVRRRSSVDVVRADIELDIDMESYLDDGAYLWGTYLSGSILPGFEQGYRPFATWSPLESAATAANFANFWRYLTDLRTASAAAGHSFAAYCYSHKAEERWLYGTPARFPDEPGMPRHAEVAAFCRSPQWVDLYLEVKRLFIVPGSLRLKAIAPVAGFNWRDPEPGGENSMAWYRAATGYVSGNDTGAAEIADIGGDTASRAVKANRQRILQYNEDDVLATLRLRQWMSTRAAEIPTASDLDAAGGW